MPGRFQVMVLPTTEVGAGDADRKVSSGSKVKVSVLAPALAAELLLRFNPYSSSKPGRAGPLHRLTSASSGKSDEQPMGRATVACPALMVKGPGHSCWAPGWITVWS